MYKLTYSYVLFTWRGGKNSPLKAKPPGLNADPSSATRGEPCMCVCVCTYRCIYMCFCIYICIYFDIYIYMYIAIVPGAVAETLHSEPGRQP